MVYMGSKSRIAKDIVPIIQKCIDDNHIETYIEPFVGGCNVIDKVRCSERIGNDKNKYLIALLAHLQNYGVLLDEVPRDLYSQVRSDYNDGTSDTKYEDWYVGNVGFLASYNGRWFDGGYAKPGYEMTKSGLRYRDYYQEAKNNILSQVDRLKDVTLSCEDYQDLPYFENDMIYCDPPYQNTKQYANSADFNYEEFWNWVRNISKTCYVLVSEINAPDDFMCVWEKSVSRSIKSADKSKAIEKLFIYKDGKYAEYICRKDTK